MKTTQDKNKTGMDKLENIDSVTREDGRPVTNEERDKVLTYLQKVNTGEIRLEFDTDSDSEAEENSVPISAFIVFDDQAYIVKFANDDKTAPS